MKKHHQIGNKSVKSGTDPYYHYYHSSYQQ